MKQPYSFLLALFWATTVIAQNEPADSAVDAELFIQKKLPYIGVEYGYGALSNSVSTMELLDFTSKDFLNDADKDDLLGTINTSLRFGFAREISVIYNQPGYRILDVYKKGQGFSIRNKFYTSANLSHDLLKLALFGNKPYEEQEVDLGGTRYESWYYTSLDYSFDLMLDTLIPIRVTVGLNVGHDYSFYGVSSGSLFTATDGEYLDLDLDYRLRDRILEAEPLAGLGLSVGAATSFKVGEKSELTVAVEDFGFIYWNNGRSVDADSTFRFQGFVFDNILDLNDSLTSAAVDDYEENFYYNEDGGYTRLTPFRLSASLRKPLDRPRLKSWFVNADYRYLAGYYPRLALGTELKLGRKHLLVTQIATGGYNVGSLDLGYSLKLARYWRFNLAITNFSGLIVPTLPGGAFGVVSLQWEY